MPDELVRRHGIDPEELKPVVDALGGGDIPGAVKAFRPEYAEKLAVAGTPEEVVENVPDVPDIQGQLQLVAERVMPAFEAAVR
jgi:5,10-methylenetetrahydromethanopterin reductase